MRASSLGLGGFGVAAPEVVPPVSSSAAARARHPSLSIIAPMYNEEENVGPLVEAVLAALGDDPDFLELVLVDDGSRDRTAATAASLAARDPRIRLVSHQRNRGLGAGIRSALAASRGELILYTDADLPWDLRQIPELLDLAAANPGHLVLGFRANREEGSWRAVMSSAYGALCRLLLGLRLRDVNFACKLFPRAAVDGLELASEGSFIDAELVLGCKHRGFEFVELPIAYQPRQRGVSTAARPRVVLGILREIIVYAFRPRPSDRR
jgi:glycosyltransferase involved in cell wall biosynthesis